MPKPDELPPHVRRLVDEIESEIGESDSLSSTRRRT